MKRMCRSSLSARRRLCANRHGWTRAAFAARRIAASGPVIGATMYLLNNSLSNAIRSAGPGARRDHPARGCGIGCAAIDAYAARRNVRDCRRVLVSYRRVSTQARKKAPPKAASAPGQVRAGTGAPRQARIARRPGLRGNPPAHSRQPLRARPSGARTGARRRPRHEPDAGARGARQAAERTFRAADPPPRHARRPALDSGAARGLRGADLARVDGDRSAGAAGARGRGARDDREDRR